jgi:hypothetical protein
MKAFQTAALTAGLLVASAVSGHAGLLVVGPGLNDSYTDFASGSETLWSLVDGVTLQSKPGYNNKNAVLHDYVVAYGAGGQESVFSLGELNPGFGGTNIAPVVNYSSGSFSLVDSNAGASARGVTDVTKLLVVQVASLPNGAGGQSKAINLGGDVTAPGAYNQVKLESLTPAEKVTVGATTYTGVSLYDFVKPTSSNSLDQIVVTSGTDGYQVVYSLAELDPAFGGSAQNLLAYASTGSDFPADGVAGTVLPNDNKHGRWNSNLDSVAVQTVPEPASWALMLLGFGGLGFASLRNRKAALVRA